MKIPKSISGHPAVESVVPGEDQGSDFKYWVFLKPGYYFTAGHAEGGCGGASFESAAEFVASRPKLKSVTN
jgi:hypothetical protein